MVTEVIRVGKRGTVVVPAVMRKQFGMEGGRFVTAEACADGILLRPATVLALETYSPARKAEFLLSNATDAADYRAARKAVKALGLDPDQVAHRKPGEA